LFGVDILRPFLVVEAHAIHILPKKRKEERGETVNPTVLPSQARGDDRRNGGGGGMGVARDSMGGEGGGGRMAVAMASMGSEGSG